MSEVIINQSNSLITFDTQLKTALRPFDCYCSSIELPSSIKHISEIHDGKRHNSSLIIDGNYTFPNTISSTPFLLKKISGDLCLFLFRSSSIIYVAEIFTHEFFHLLSHMFNMFCMKKDVERFKPNTVTSAVKVRRSSVKRSI